MECKCTALPHASYMLLFRRVGNKNLLLGSCMCCIRPQARLYVGTCSTLDGVRCAACKAAHAGACILHHAGGIKEVAAVLRLLPLFHGVTIVVHGGEMLHSVLCKLHGRQQTLHMHSNLGRLWHASCHHWARYTGCNNSRIPTTVSMRCLTSSTAYAKTSTMKMLISSQLQLWAEKAVGCSLSQRSA